MVAGADVVDDGVAVDVFAEVRGGDAEAAFANDEGELGLVESGWVGLLGSTIASPGPMIAEVSLKNTTGVVGSSIPDSLAWSRWLRPMAKMRSRFNERGVELDFAEAMAGVDVGFMELANAGSDGGQGVVTLGG